MGSGLIWIYGKILISLIRDYFLEIQKMCTVSTNILRGDENFDFPY